MTELETLHAEIDEIRSNVTKILFILENEGEVNKKVLKELKESKSATKDKFLPHETLKRSLK
ncbi:MAG TPA: hypothetical protein VJH34_01795 [archaeon]|nr:hypothetical protein [archaeon]